MPLDLEIITVLFAAVALIAIVYWLVTRRPKRKMEIPYPVEPPVFYRPRGYSYNPGPSIIETNSGFSEGLIIGSAMRASSPVEVIEVERDVVMVDSQPDVPTFAGFDGGDSGGGGATSDWSSSSDSSTCSSDSYSDSSSSCDSSSSSDSDS